MLITGCVLVAVGILAGGGGGSALDAPSTRVLSTSDGPQPLQNAAAESAPDSAAAPVVAEAPIVPGDDPPPTITGSAAVVMEDPCGAVLHGLNPHSPLPPASLTKIATALVAVDYLDMNQVIDVIIDGGALSMQTDATVMGLKPGQRLSLADLVGGMMMRSGNDAAITIAEAVAGSEEAFADLMNQKAAALGLEDTHFANSHGLDDPQHYTSAFDIAVLGQQLLRNPRLAQIVQSKSYTPNWDGGPLQNINLLLGNYPGAIGIKTGYTDLAGATIVGAAERDGRRLVVSVLQSGDPYVDASALLDWAFNNTEPACSAPAQAQAAATPAAQVAVAGR
jgi:D-alanyl-D-alanine carboxypeptidase